MADTKQKIGDPLAEAAQSGVLGGSRKPIGTKEPGGPATPPERELTPAKQPEVAAAGRVSTRKPKPKREREKKTILFETERAKWLEIQAATERREMSEIVADALELYERLYENGK